MNHKIFVTALLTGLTAAVHIFIGTPEIEKPLMQSLLSEEIRLLLFACWHLVSITLTFSAIAFFVAARDGCDIRYQCMVKLLSLHWLSFGILFIVIALCYSGAPMLLTLPQWTLLLPIGALGFWGSSHSSFYRTLKK